MLSKKLSVSLESLVMSIDMDHCIGKNFNDQLKYQTKADVINLQDTLWLDDGVTEDFKVALDAKGLLKFTGNFITALIVLKHLGLLTLDETSHSARTIEKIMKEIFYFDIGEPFKFGYRCV